MSQENIYLTVSQLYDAIRQEPKNHGEFPFTIKRKKLHDGRNPDGYCSLRLYFNDAQLAPYSDGEVISWIVQIDDYSRPMTMNAVLRHGNNRVSSIDPVGVPVSYKYDKTMRKRACYHMNVISFDKDRKITNTHVELPELYSHFENVYKFAEFVAGKWAIDYWTSQDGGLFDDQC